MVRQDAKKKRRENTREQKKEMKTLKITSKNDCMQNVCETRQKRRKGKACVVAVCVRFDSIVTTSSGGSG